MNRKDNNLEVSSKIVISKTKLKKNMHDLQNLGLRLTDISKSQLMKIDIPANLITEIENYKKITSFVAAKRQKQYIGKLISKLGESDKEKIYNFLAIQDGTNKIYQAKIKKIDNTIEYLLNDNNYLTQYIKQHENINISEIRMLIRNIKKDYSENRPTKYYKLLYNMLKDIENFN